MILGLQQELKAEGASIRLVKLREWFEIPRRTVYYQPTNGKPKLQERFVKPNKAMIEENPSFGYRTVAHLLEGWHLSSSGKSKTAEAALEQALYPLWLLGKSPDVVPAAFGEWLGLDQQELHRAGQELWTAAGIHHALQPCSRTQWWNE